MRKSIFDQRGISLIEVLAASAILSIVAIAAGGFLLANLFSYNTTSDNITMEREGRAALNAITDKVRESAYVVSVVTEDGGTAIAEMDRTNTTYRTVYSVGLSDGAELSVQEGKKLVLSGITLSNNLDSKGLKVEPLPEGSSFESCTGLKIKLILKKEKRDYNIESEAYFRNSKMN